jgi:hypothetical protein
MPLTHLERLEAESIHILREVVAEAQKPVMLYSVGKDSAVMLHLARKAFYPAPPPFPLLHVDTTWKFKAMYEFRDRMARESAMPLLVHQNPDAKARGINPFDHGASVHTVAPVFVGPEIAQLWCGDYQQMEFGAHITGVRINALEWSMGTGFALTSDQRYGPYLRAGFNARY